MLLKFIAVLLFITFVIASPIELNAKNFDKEIAKGKTFVKFYAPWCGHCKKLAPIWDELADASKAEGISIARVDCTKDYTLCTRFDVTGYPTLKFFDQGKLSTYKGERELVALQNYARSAETTESVPAPTKVETIQWKSDSDTIKLDNSNFQQILTGDWLVAFYADWCPHCKKVSVDYEDVAKQLKDKVKVGRVNIDLISSVISRAFNVTQVPTIVYLKDGKMYSVVYKSQGSSFFVEFVESAYKDVESQEIPKLPAAKAPSTPENVPGKIISAYEELFDQIKQKIGEFDLKQQEAIMGLAAGFSLFILGFILGRATASPAPTKSNAKKTN